MNLAYAYHTRNNVQGFSQWASIISAVGSIASAVIPAVLNRNRDDGGSSSSSTAAYQQQLQPAPVQVVMPQQTSDPNSISTNTLLLIAGAGLVAFMIARK